MYLASQIRGHFHWCNNVSKFTVTKLRVIISPEDTTYGKQEFLPELCRALSDYVI